MRLSRNHYHCRASSKRSPTCRPADLPTCTGTAVRLYGAATSAIRTPAAFCFRSRRTPRANRIGRLGSGSEIRSSHYQLRLPPFPLPLFSPLLGPFLFLSLSFSPSELPGWVENQQMGYKLSENAETRPQQTADRKYITSRGRGVLGDEGSYWGMFHVSTLSGSG